MEHVEETSAIFSSFTAGSINADECFCLVLSVDGYERTRHDFLKRIDVYKLTNPGKYKQLHKLYITYFEQTPSEDFTDPVGASVENGYFTSDFGYELDMEMALVQSLSQQTLERSENLGHVPSDIRALSVNQDEITYANAAKNTLPVSATKPNEYVSSICNDTVCKHGTEYCRPSFSCKSELQESSVNCSSVQREQIRSAHANLSFNSSIPSSKCKKKRKSGKGGPKVSRPLTLHPVIYWIRRDIRLYDNPALVAAAESGCPVIFTFLWQEKEEDPDNVLAVGGATKLWLHYALKELNDNLVDKYGHGIIFRKTDNSTNEMKRLITETGAKTLYINNVYEPFLSYRDDKICQRLESCGVSCQRFDSYLLNEPASVSSESIGMRGIGSVTHFMECCRQSSTKTIGHPVNVPDDIPKAGSTPERHTLEDLGLARMPKRKDGTVIDWSAPIRKSWDFSETGAWNAFTLFLEEGIWKYEKESCRADNLHTCRISPYLHFGQISPRAVLTEARGMKTPKFLRKLAWRDLSYWLLTLWPDLPSQPIRVHYRDQRWSSNALHLKAWQKGNTGFPLIDSAMRQLWLTGWINNYMRHVVASFLISYLHIHWREGYRWFQDTLVDADVAINAMMWQNGGMSGLDQWNFVMHPVDAALTCDPNGTYVRKWCPELSQLPNEFIHQPWKCPPSIMKRCHVELGMTYPKRIITDLEKARDQSLKDVVDVRKNYPQYVDRRNGNDLVPLPNGLTLPCITRAEFKYKTSNPQAQDNPHTAVLRGYRSRKRDEAIAFANQRDFTASTMNECVMRKERNEKASQYNSIY